MRGLGGREGLDGADYSTPPSKIRRYISGPSTINHMMMKPIAPYRAMSHGRRDSGVAALSALYQAMRTTTPATIAPMFSQSMLRSLSHAGAPCGAAPSMTMTITIWGCARSNYWR